MSEISSYPSVYAIGHKAIQELFSGPVIVEEKIDGSQFSMMLDKDGNLKCRSKGKEQYPDGTDKMFQQAVETAKSLPLVRGWSYRCEYLAKPQHNALTYSRVPKQHLILFDVETGMQEFMQYEQKAAEAERIGLEVVPLLRSGIVTGLTDLQGFLERESILGGVKIEGVVVKNYAVFTQEKKIACGKYVSEAFKEVHTKEWKNANPSNKDIITLLIEELRTERRWEKAVEHLRDSGQIEGSLRDIGTLIREVPNDVKKECADHIKDRLFAHAWPHIQRSLTSGLPQWYKDKLAAQAFAPSEQSKCGESAIVGKE